MPTSAAPFIKQSKARQGQGSSRGVRTIMLFRRGELTAFRLLADRNGCAR